MKTKAPFERGWSHMNKLDPITIRSNYYVPHKFELNGFQR